ncbi:hypothetical protein LGH83_01925 [Lichenihabitans sp. PAMC28606]|uniref:hypothetical protein n=1 Tax=Lichenihabitans sp. PAMC28606 TaxID=2880932 RepID=UPI001D0A0C2D|nr:hypothetical protein [Lichenihabitans sp. PAMC28606]UDL95045.1 hypothetical protein LGH83_01925 [Lichenihabitans sp. PAMC28606]
MQSRLRLSLGLATAFSLALGLTSSALAQADAPAVAAPTATTAAPSAATAPSAAEKLTGLSAWKALVGNTISGRSGDEMFSQYFDAGGKVRYVDQNGLSTGTWAVQGERVCFDFPEDDDHSCSAFEVTGSSGSAIDQDGAAIKFDITSGNSKGL